MGMFKWYFDRKRRQQDEFFEDLKKKTNAKKTKNGRYYSSSTLGNNFKTNVSIIVNGKTLNPGDPGYDFHRKVFEDGMRTLNQAMGTIDSAMGGLKHMGRTSNEAFDDFKDIFKNWNDDDKSGKGAKK